MPSRLLHVRTGRHPHEILVLAFTAVLGLIGAIVPESISDAISHEFPWPWSMVFWIAMLLSSLVTLFGIFNHKIEGLLIERAGLTMHASMLGIYTYAVLQYAGLGGLVGMVLPLALICGNLWRCFMIRTDLVLLTAYLKDHPGEQVR